MQPNDVNHAVKRVSSDEIKRNYTQITGEEAVMRLFAKEEVFGASRGMSWKIVDGMLCRRTYLNGVAEECEESAMLFNAFLKSTDWYIAPPFDARKEMLARPGEWVAKFKTMTGWAFIGFDLPEMVAVYSENIGDAVDINGPAIVPAAREINTAIPLDDADLAKLAALKADEKGVEA